MIKDVVEFDLGEAIRGFEPLAETWQVMGSAGRMWVTAIRCEVPRMDNMNRSEADRLPDCEFIAVWRVDANGHTPTWACREHLRDAIDMGVGLSHGGAQMVLTQVQSYTARAVMRYPLYAPFPEHLGG